MSIPIWLILFLILVPTAAAVWFAREAFRQQTRLPRLSRAAQSRQRHYQDLDIRQKSEADLRRHTEEKLRGYLQLLDTLINTIPNPIFYRDAAGVFRGCNQAFAKIVLGLTRDRIIGQTAETLRGRIPDDLSACLQGDGRHGSSFEAPVPCADGR